MARRYSYETCCVNSDGPSINAMQEASKQISRSTFLRHARDVNEWARDMSYSVGSERGLHLKDDWHVDYRRSTYRGRPCVYVVHSMIEYIWTLDQ